MQSFSERIKARAYEIGFTKAGIARAEKLNDEGGRLFQWLDAGYHDNMAWMRVTPKADRSGRDPARCKVRDRRRSELLHAA